MSAMTTLAKHGVSLKDRAGTNLYWLVLRRFFLTSR